MSSSSNTNDYTKKINIVYDKQLKLLDTDEKKSIEKIGHWCSKTIDRINKHAEKEVEKIKDHYSSLRRTFNQQHKDTVEIADSYHEKLQSDLFNELHEAYSVMKYKLVTIKYEMHEVSYPEVKFVEDQLEKDNSNDDDDDVQVPNIDSTPKSTTEPLSDARKRRRAGKPPPSNSTESTNQFEDTDDSFDKCPLCFMIFSSKMTQRDREIHINEHCTDE